MSEINAICSLILNRYKEVIGVQLVPGEDERSQNFCRMLREQLELGRASMVVGEERITFTNVAGQSISFSLPEASATELKQAIFGKDRTVIRREDVRGARFPLPGLKVIRQFVEDDGNRSDALKRVA